MTRDLDTAKHYFRGRYAEAPDARYGLVASSRDKSLQEWGIPNDWHSTQRVDLGPWYGDGDESHRSCRRLSASASPSLAPRGWSSTACCWHGGPTSSRRKAPGLEVADLVVSPIGRFVAGRPPREHWTMVEAKLRRRKGDYLGAGLVILPTE